MATTVSPDVLADAHRILVEMRMRPRGYIYLRKMLGDDPERALRALDRLKGLGLVRSRKINLATHYEAVT